MPNVVRHLVGINPGATGNDRRFEVPQPGESVLLIRPVEMTDGWYNLDAYDGRVLHTSSTRMFGWGRSEASGAVPAPGSWTPSGDQWSEASSAIHSAGGGGFGGPIIVHVTDGYGNNPSSGNELSFGDYTGNLADGNNNPSMMWFDWEFTNPPPPGNTCYVNPRAENAIASFMWGGVDNSDIFDIVTGGSENVGYTGASYPILSAVKAGHEGHTSEDNYETASFYSYQKAPSAGASYQWDLYGNAEDGINVDKLHGRTLVSSNGTIQVSHSGTEKCRIDGTANGYVIGHSTTSTMEVDSSSNVTFSSTTDNDGGAATTTGSVMFNGGVYIAKNLNIEKDLFVSISSDERLKKNISTFKNATTMVGKLRGAEFDWKEEANKPIVHDYGVIAQDVEKVLPHAVKEREDGTLAVDYIKITPLLIEAVKELTERVKELENKNSKTSF